MCRARLCLLFLQRLGGVKPHPERRSLRPALSLSEQLAWFSSSRRLECVRCRTHFDSGDRRHSIARRFEREPPMGSSDLSMLSRGAGSLAVQVPRPRSRLVTRVLLPALILLGTLGVLAYAM